MKDGSGSASTESTLLAAGGALFLLLAGFFLWRDLDLPPEMIMLAATFLSGAAAVLAVPRRWPALAPAALLASTTVAGLWYLADHGLGLLPALGVALVAALVTVLRTEGRRPPAEALAHRLRWYGLGVALLASSWAGYFQLFTVGVAADSVARRLIPTIVWLALGLALFLAGRLRARPAAHVGLALVGVALGKAVLYDTTHLAGGLRVVVLAAVGALLLFAARVARPAQASAKPSRAD